MKVNVNIQPGDLKVRLNRFFELSARKIRSIDSTWDPGRGTPVFTEGGKYTTRGWTEWTQGFQFGCAILGYEITGEDDLLQIGREGTLERMASHVTHIGVHDHGFNNVSTYGNLRRLMREGVMPENEWERHFYELALKAVWCCSSCSLDDHCRWQRGIFIRLMGPHSLFSDTIRSCRALAVAHDLGHVLMGENDRAISLLERMIHHAETTAQFNVYYGEGRDRYDVRGRVVHESIFNVNDGNYRCPSTQQGYSPFSTWTRGLAWIVTGYAELLEYVAHLSDDALDLYGGRDTVNDWMLQGGLCNGRLLYRQYHCLPMVFRFGMRARRGLIESYGDKISDPYNGHEPVDSSAAAIAAQGLYRLGKYLDDARYQQAGVDGGPYAI